MSQSVRKCHCGTGRQRDVLLVLVLRVIIADDGTGRPLGYCVEATRHAGGYGGEPVKKKQMEGGREETGLAERKRCRV